MKKKYDIFISYRRTSYDTANLIATRLKAAGYSVFFDVETLRSGKFNEQLFEVIQQCKDFLLVLPSGALDRCVNEDDWVRQEVMCAISSKKNIIPILLNGFIWPDTMPLGMEELKDYQALTASSIEYFDLSIERLRKQYLHSKSRRPFLKAIKILCITALSIALLILSLWVAFMSVARGVCEQYASSIVKGASAVHAIAEQNQMVMKEWAEYTNAVKYNAPEKKVKNLRSNVIDAVQLANTNIQTSWIVDDQSLDISAFHSFLLSLFGINVQEVQDFPVYCSLFYEDYCNLLQQIVSLDISNEYSVDWISAWLSSEEHQFVAFYADVLAVLSSFPSKSLDAFLQVRPEWIYFPYSIKIGEPRQYYDDISANAMRLAEEKIRGYESTLNIADAQLDEMEEQLDEIASKESEFEAAVKQIEDVLDQTYSDMINHFSFEETDDQWTKWGEIQRWGKFLSYLVESYANAKKDGYVLSSSVTPEKVLEKINQMLNAFQNQYADSKDYIPSVRAFFRDVSKGEREYAGVLVFAFSENKQHPFLKVGDIITTYNGVKLVSLETLKSEYQNTSDGLVIVDRLTKGHFESVTGKMEEPEIVGFLDIVEN